MKILLIEDSPTIQKTILANLSKLFPDELEVFVAFNGKEGFKMMTTDSFELIITDIDMQDGDGGTFLAKITNNKILSKKKVVVFSSHKPPIDLPNIKYVNKALGMHALSEAIKALTK